MGLTGQGHSNFPLSGVFSNVLQFEQRGIGNGGLLHYPTFTLLYGTRTSCRFCFQKAFGLLILVGLAYHMYSPALSYTVGCGTLNCGFPPWPESHHIRQLGHPGVSQGDPVDAELSADAGSTFLLGKSRQSVVRVWNASNSCQCNTVGARELGSGRVHCRRQAALSEGFRDLFTYVPYFLITILNPKDDPSA